MINQVLVAGRLAADPRIHEGPGGPWVELELDVERPPRDGSPSRSEQSRVRVNAFGERNVSNLTRFLRQGRSVLVHGFLRAEDGGLRVVAERWEFMEDGLVVRAPAGARRVAAA